MPLLKKLYTKLDNGSISNWEAWDGETIHSDSLFALGQLQARVIKERGDWRIFYRMGSDDIDNHPLFKEKFKDESAICEGLDRFMDWAYDNEIRLLEAHERHCDNQDL